MRAGTYKNNLSGEFAYKSFVPSKLPPQPPLEYDNELVGDLAAAHSALAKLQAAGTYIPSLPLFVGMYVRKEALLSSQIEGTQATLDDILDPHIEKNTNQDIADVVNYIKASDRALKRLEDLPLCNRLLLETHAILMEGLRGGEKTPGEFRRSQNWIGAAGSTIRTARYIPPNPQDMEEAMNELEKYINEQDDTDPLVKIALIHYQFETIHPFLDGNGRIGRLLVFLFLKSVDLLSLPTLYISYFLKRNRIEYYDRLNEVRLKGNYEQWVKFFLRAVKESAEDATASIDLLAAMHERNLKLIREKDSGKSFLEKVFLELEKRPITDVGGMAKSLNSTFVTTDKAFKLLVDLGILEQAGSQKRNRRFVYKEYLDVLRRDT
ncbi:MAG TPA: Fic family protein [Clostridiales bacterium]|nr:Fic family protein [Clostridiales bacterium]